MLGTPLKQIYGRSPMRKSLLLFSIPETKPICYSNQVKLDNDNKSIRQVSIDFISSHMVIPAVYNIL